MEQTYFGSEVASTLKIGSSTLRKYSLALEEQGYVFDRGMNNSRIFYQKDVAMIQRIMNAMNKKNITLEQAIKLAISSVPEDIVATAVMDKQTESSIGVAMLERLERLEKINLELVKRLEEQQRMLQERDTKRDEQLITVLREVQESKQLIATTKDKKWWEFWR
jgi:DNA-binding transcriptional MerR regulator